MTPFARNLWLAAVLILLALVGLGIADLRDVQIDEARLGALESASFAQPDTVRLQGPLARETGEMDQWLARPLFWPERRPFAPEAAIAATPGAALPPDTRLVGIVEGAGGPIVLDRFAGGKPERLRAGEAILRVESYRNSARQCHA